MQNLLAYHDTNDHNCNKISAMLSLFAEFITEFERSCAIDMPLLMEAVAYSLMSKISSLPCALFLLISWNTLNAYSPQNLKSAF